MKKEEIMEVQAEAIKEFAERLKKTAVWGDVYTDKKKIWDTEIDITLRNMLNERTVTPAEAIEYLQKHIGKQMGGKSLELAIEALEKQIPKKPNAEEYLKLSPNIKNCIGECPCCKHGIVEYSTDLNHTRKKEKFCVNCGQALDWSDEE